MKLFIYKLQKFIIFIIVFLTFFLYKTTVVKNNIHIILINLKSIFTLVFVKLIILISNINANIIRKKIEISINFYINNMEIIYTIFFIYTTFNITIYKVYLSLVDRRLFFQSLMGIITC